MNAKGLILFTVVASALTAPAPSTVSDILTANNLTMMAEQFSKNGMNDVTSSAGPITVIAISNNGIKTWMESDGYKNVSSSPEMMKKMMMRHVVMSKLAVSDLRDDMVVTMSSGETVYIDIYGKMVTVNGMPMTMLPSSGNDNVVVYVVERWMATEMTNDIGAVLDKNADMFSTFSRMIQQAPGVADMLKGSEQMTLFAPTNDAFNASMPAGSMDKMTPAEMKKCVMDHLVKGALYLGGVTSAVDLTNMNGTPLRVAINGNVATVNGTKITMMDIPAKNGVVHAIDRVIMPPAPQA